jgi:hypothetical protein
MNRIGALAICFGWSAIYAICVLVLIEFALWLMSLLGYGTYPVPFGRGPTIPNLARACVLIYFIIQAIQCLMNSGLGAGLHG